MKSMLAPFRTKDGQEVDPEVDEWTIKMGVYREKFNFSQVKPLMAPAFYRVLKMVVSESLKKHALNTTANYFWHFGTLVYFVAGKASRSLSSIGKFEIVSYAGSLSSDTRWYLGSIRSFLKFWCDLGYLYVRESYDCLEEMRIPGNPKGEAVRTRDPIRGAFSRLEHENLVNALNTAFSRGELEIGHYFQSWIFLGFGIRPGQMAALKLKDLKVKTSEEGLRSFSLNIPSGKKNSPRETSRERPLTHALGTHLHAYVGRLLQIFADDLEAPLFPDYVIRDSAIGFKNHYLADTLSRELREALHALGVWSERTNAPLKINCIRFRRTFATRMREGGASILEIAELLDHADDQNAGVYGESSPELVERIDKATAFLVGPLAKAFKGTLISSWDDEGAKNFDDVRDLDVNGDDRVGKCSHDSSCGFMRPRACYTCPVNAFRPWRDGPHEEILEKTLKARDKLLDSADPKIAAGYDKSVFAMAQVVQMCAEANSKKAC